MKKMMLEQPSTWKKLTSDKTLIHNLMMMMIVWTAASFIFFLFGFLVKYMPGDIYFNSVISGLSAIAMLTEGKIEHWFGVKGGITWSYLVGVIAIIGLCFFDKGTTQILLFACVLLIAKSVISLAFGLAYAIHIELFPSNFLISSYGICNFFCRGLTIFAPLIAEVENPMIPNVSMVVLAFLGFLAAFSLKKRREEDAVEGFKDEK